ncbi:MAG: class I SAM-dependent methyltransferase [Candidatus Nanoarchaeia archaeon]|jgi:ubiquinone/menaquinone biosynthesis C-methylase UbiE|nr:class I SAM-dependent methyltransferase [Candidatus Nanoarchaeia archaeon]|tara:strand:+ start:37152 stop:37886 length:735 start_codon:yes stop_codon:yes gene_type:complete
MAKNTKIIKYNLRGRSKFAYNWTDKVGNILDVGCASGYFTVHFKDKAKNVYGVDIKKDLIDEAKKKYKDINFKLIKSEKLPFKANMFDVVLLLDVLEHVNNDKLMIDEIYRVLKKDGLLILSVPHKGLLTFLDPDNLKITMPSLYKLLYVIVKRKFPIIKNEIHKHYSFEEINRLIENKFRINKLHIGGSIISTLTSYFEIIIARLFNRNYFNNAFTIIKNLDYSINYRRIGDNIIIRAKKINI